MSEEQLRSARTVADALLRMTPSGLRKWKVKAQCSESIWAALVAVEPALKDKVKEVTT